MGVGADLVTGERRKAEGEGIVIVAIELNKVFEAVDDELIVSRWRGERERWLSCALLLVRREEGSWPWHLAGLAGTSQLH